MLTAEPASSPASPPPTPSAKAPQAAPEKPGLTGLRGLRDLRRKTLAAAYASWRQARAAVAVFAVARLAGVAVVTLWAHRRHAHPRNLLGLEWDASWYHRIAEWGYGTFIPSWEAPGMRYDDLAFFPLYPMTVRAVDAVLPVGAVASALLVAWTCSVVAAWGVYTLTDHCYGRRIAVGVVLLWSLLPHAVVLSMAYTEPMMSAFAAWALYATVTRRWLTAGVLGVLAGLSRPNAVAVTAAVVAAVLADAWHRHRTGRGQSATAWAAALLAPLGWCGYVLWVGVQTGDPVRGYFEVQSRWGSDFDFGHYALHYVKHLVLFPDSLSAYMAAAISAGAVLLLALAVLDRMPLPLLVYCAVLVVIALGGANFFACKPRFLLPAFPLLVPCAAALSRARPRAAALAVVTLAGISLGYGAYVLTIVTVPL